MRESLFRSAVLGLLAVIAASTSLYSEEPYQTGTLLDITHQDSSRVVQNPQSGVVTNVNDREYQIAIKIGAMTYVGSYWPRWRWSYEPTDFVVNTAVKVRLTKKEMFLLRSDNKELKTKIIKRIAQETATTR